MKRICCILLLMCLMLSACGAPAAKTIYDTGITYGSRAAHEADAAPYIRTPQPDTGGETDKSAKYESCGSPDYPPVPADFLARVLPPLEEAESMGDLLKSCGYAEFGSFYIRDAEYFNSLPQDEPCKIVMHYEDSMDNARKNAVEKELTDLDITSLYIRSCCEKGEQPEGYDYDFDQSRYDNICGLGSDAFKLLPREYFEIWQRMQALSVELNTLRDEQSRASAMHAAEVFCSLGLDAEVRAYEYVEDGERRASHICVVTLTPSRLWELGDELTELFSAERLWQSVDDRFDVHVWP